MRTTSLRLGHAPHLKQFHGLDEGVEEGVEAIHHVHDLVGLGEAGEQGRANGAQQGAQSYHRAVLQMMNAPCSWSQGAGGA